MEKILLDELSNIISAYKEGKALQFYTSCGEFKDVSAEEFDIEKWYKKPKKFRIKEEPKYRPFANTEECWQEMEKHQPFIKYKVIESDKDVYLIIQRIKIDGIETDVERLNFETAFKRFTFADGTPFGVKVEE